MLKYAKITDNETKKCMVGTGTNTSFYQNNGMELLDVEMGYDGCWYLSGYLPEVPKKSYQQERLEHYPNISDQLDMIYWDKVNGTNLWQQKIAEVKALYPKE